MPVSASFTNLIQAASSPGSVQLHVADVHPSALPFLVAAMERDTGRSVAVIARDMGRCLALCQEIRHLVSPGDDGSAVLCLPAPYVSPYMEVSVDSRLQAQGMGTLSRLAANRGARVLVLPPSMLAAVHPPIPLVRDACRIIERGQEFDREKFIESLADAGYVRVSAVAEPGTFSVRGSLVDLFSPGEGRPVRIDFFGDAVEALSTFDPDSQLSSGKQAAAHVAPATPVGSHEGMLERSRKALLDLADRQDCPAESLSRLIESLRAGDLPPSAAPLLPMLAGAGSPITDYLPKSQWLLLFEDQAAVLHAVTYLHETEKPRYAASLDRGRLALPPQDLFHTATKLRELLKGYTRVNVAALDPEANLRFSIPMTRPLSPVSPGGSRLTEFETKAGKLGGMGFKTIACAPDQREAQRIGHLLAGHGASVRIEEEEFSLAAVLEKPAAAGVRVFSSGIAAGVESADLALFVATVADLFDKKPAAPVSTERAAAEREHLLDLDEGDFVVHQDYGIARFAGMERRKTAAGEFMCLKLAYSGEDVVYVPVHNSAAVQKYVGAGKAAPRLDKLGGATWAGKVAKARKGAKRLAFDLLGLYAKRVAASGFAFSPSDNYFEEFEARFPYEETPDQASAIQDVLSDMEKGAPMDRLVCGDVGFGKTEVAIRAAFKAVLDGRQVAVLVPTTVLCEQHRMTFQQRLADYPVVVESISRFKSAAEQKQMLRRLKEGQVDVVIGTHRLLSKDVAFKSLGLLVVDEEHRFGVGHKEKLKTLRSTVDVLSLTATPIPRTLHMAMSGIRDLSVIKTPPPGRLDIQTLVIHYDAETLGNAIRGEVSRGGQVFFLHNKVEDILNVRDQLAALLPGVRIGVGHVQMAEKALERVMLDFMAARFDVLLCTTIIESGLDLPNVNTLIVNNAHMFGLAQLYQIRGRVGRANRQAYAYFVVPPTETMPTEARQRLATLTKFHQVGSGFQVASIDMALRGAGDILGANQSGHVSAVGFDMYVHLLHEEVGKLKEQADFGPARQDCQVEIPVEASVPDDYIPDRHQRLVFYRMAASADSASAVERLRFETRDRFGALPESVSRLLSVAEIRVRSAALAITRLEVSTSVIKAQIGSCPDKVLQGILALVREQTVPIRLTPDHVLTADLSQHGAPDPVARARRFLNYLERAVDGR